MLEFHLSLLQLGLLQFDLLLRDALKPRLLLFFMPLLLLDSCRGSSFFGLTLLLGCLVAFTLGFQLSFLNGSRFTFIQNQFLLLRSLADLSLHW